MNTSTFKGPALKPPRPLSPVHQAIPDDLENLVWFLREMLPEIGDGTADFERLVAWANAMVQRQGGVALIVRGDDRIEASLGVVWENPILHRDMHMRVVWNCVLPEYRNTGHAKSLIAQAKMIADGTGRPLFLEEFTPDPEAGKVKLARRHMTPLGQLFVHQPG